MNFIQTAERLYTEILNIQNPLYEKHRLNAAPPEMINIQDFSLHEHNVKIVFDQVNLKIIYVSESFEEMTGYLAAEFSNYALVKLFNHISLDHFMYPYHMAKWTKDVYDKNKILKNLKVYTCGLKVKNFKNQKNLRLLIRYSPLEVFENDLVKLAAITVDDVTHLLKNDHYLLRMESGEQGEFINFFSSIEKKDVPKEILSKREKQILQMIAEGKESKEIAANLFISLNTVENHRRNMILQMGARDSTALIQLCRMMNII